MATQGVNRPRALVLFIALVIGLGLGAGVLGSGCSSRNDVTNVVAPEQSTMIARVDAIMHKDVATPEDQRFLSSLNASELEEVFAYYKFDSLAAVPSATDHKVASPSSVLSLVTFEIRQLGWGYGGWVASGWIDGDEHRFLYPGVPNGYADRGRLALRTVNPGVWAAFTYYRTRQGFMTAQVATPSNNVWLIVGSALHIFLYPTLGNPHEAWRATCYLYRI